MILGVPILLHLAGTGSPVRVLAGPGLAYHANPSASKGSIMLLGNTHLHVKESLDEIDVLLSKGYSAAANGRVHEILNELVKA